MVQQTPSRTHSPLTANQTSAKLCLIATSDVHMHLVGDSGATGFGEGPFGLAQTATLIDEARSARPESLTLTLDNGDLLQGSAMADVMADATAIAQHPLPACMSAVGFDAVGLGNHDFDYGLQASKQIFNAFECPVLSANFKAPGLEFILPFTVLERRIRDSSGTEHPIKVGITSALPQQTGIWNYKHLRKTPPIGHPVEAVATVIPQMRAAGAEVIVVLAHTGIADNPANTSPGAPESFALEIAGIEGIDGIICGHTHRLFPGPDHGGIAGVDTKGGTLNEVPAVMPGFGGCHIGTIDFDLIHENGRWRVTGSRSAIASVTQATRARPDIMHLCAEAIRLTKTEMARPVGTAPIPLNSYFALMRPDAAQPLLGRGMIDVIAQAALGTPYHDLPILAATCPNATGDDHKPHDYFDIPAGPILKRHITTLSPFQDEIWAVQVTGAEVLEWLERSASLFAKLDAAATGQNLTENHAPGYNFDTIIGVEATYDPTVAARYTTYGHRTASSARRVVQATYQGRDISPDQKFLMAATSYRAAGGGRFPGTGVDKIALRTPVTIPQVFEMVLGKGLTEQPTQQPSWRFAPDLGVSAILRTGKGAASHLNDIARFSPRIIGSHTDGLVHIRVTL